MTARQLDAVENMGCKDKGNNSNNKNHQAKCVSERR